MPFLLFYSFQLRGRGSLQAYQNPLRGRNGRRKSAPVKKVVDKSIKVWYSILTRANKAQEKGRIKMKKIIAILRAMLADETPYIPDVYNVQAFGTNGLF